MSHAACHYTQDRPARSPGSPREGPGFTSVLYEPRCGPGPGDWATCGQGPRLWVPARPQPGRGAPCPRPPRPARPLGHGEAAERAAPRGRSSGSPTRPDGDAGGASGAALPRPAGSPLSPPRRLPPRPRSPPPPARLTDRRAPPRPLGARRRRRQRLAPTGSEREVPPAGPCPGKGAVLAAAPGHPGSGAARSCARALRKRHCQGRRPAAGTRPGPAERALPRSEGSWSVSGWVTRAGADRVGNHPPPAEGAAGEAARPGLPLPPRQETGTKQWK